MRRRQAEVSSPSNRSHGPSNAATSLGMGGMTKISGAAPTHGAKKRMPCTVTWAPETRSGTSSPRMRCANSRHSRTPSASSSSRVSSGTRSTLRSPAVVGEAWSPPAAALPCAPPPDVRFPTLSSRATRSRTGNGFRTRTRTTSVSPAAT